MEVKEAEPQYAETSGKALIDHWKWAASKGLLNENTAGALRAAVKQVLSIEEDGDNVDIRNLDVDQLLHRWVNLKKGSFKPESLETYQQRFRQALNLYLSYLDNPSGYRPARPKTTSAARSNGKVKAADAPAAPGASVITLEPQQRGDVTVYPFPIREGVMARLSLPVDLKAAEVKRLTAFMNTLVVEEIES